MSDNVRAVRLRAKVITLVGTAHISPESVVEVREIIAAEVPDRVCVEIDKGRYAAMVEKRSWENLDIMKVLKDGRGFLLLANLVRSSFQRRMGAAFAVAPGDELRAAIGSLLAFGHPLTILASLLGSPVVVLKPFVSSGLVAAYVEARDRRPKVSDFQNLNEDITSFSGFYRNKITRILLVFLFCSLGGAVGNFISLAAIGSRLF